MHSFLFMAHCTDSRAFGTSRYNYVTDMDRREDGESLLYSGPTVVLGQAVCLLSGVERLSAIRRFKMYYLYGIRSIGGTGFVHCTEVVRFLEMSVICSILYTQF